MENIKVKVLEGGYMPEKHGDWFDLALAEPVNLKAGEWVYASLGLCIGLPTGYGAIVAPRSSTFKKYGLIMANSIGVIEHDYCGEDDIWRVPLYATRDVEVEAGTRVCQFRLDRLQPASVLVRVNSMDAPSRGGFGSTGERVG